MKDHTSGSLAVALLPSPLESGKTAMASYKDTVLKGDLYAYGNDVPSTDIIEMMTEGLCPDLDPMEEVMTRQWVR